MLQWDRDGFGETSFLHDISGGLTAPAGWGSDPVADACTAVSASLWAQRDALETLLFRLVEEQLIVSSGSTRWLARADTEVAKAIDTSRAGEVLRAVEVDALTAVLGLPAEATLAELASAVPEPWTTVFDDHRTALRGLALDVQAVAGDNRHLLEAGAAAVRESLDRITRDVRTYNATGRAVDYTSGPLLLDQQA
jgi:hypothetical protein